MSESKHTPGPWVAVPGKSVLNITTDRGSAAAHIATVDSVQYWENFTEVDAANARLIAAAPELLAALRRMVSDSMFKDHPEASAMAINAIAKATGAQS